MLRPLLIASLALALLVTPVALAPAHAAPGGGLGPTPIPMPFITRDLYVTSIKVMEGSGDVVQTPTAIVTIRNAGFLSAGPFWVRVYTFTDGKARFSWRYVSGLAGLQSTTLYVKMDQTSYSTNNYYFVHASVDHLHQVSEANEGNNIKWASFTK